MIKKLRKPVSILLSLVMIFSVFSIVPFTSNAAEGEIYVGFTSDVHGQTSRLNKLLDAFFGNYGTIDSMVYCGDFGVDSNKTMDATGYFKQFVEDIVPNDNSLIAQGKFNNVVYTTGNHEFNTQENVIPGTVPAALADQPNFTRIGQAVPKAGENDPGYIVYCFGAPGYYKTQGGGFFDGDDVNPSDIEALDTFLSTAPTDVPVFIASHHPLHSYYKSSGTNRYSLNADKVINTLNKYADQGVDIVFIWGHNHSMQDPLYGKIIGKGGSYDKIQCNYNSPNQETEIRFTYAAAGGIRNDASGSETNFSGLVTTIDTVDKNMTFRYYNCTSKAEVGYPTTVSYGGNEYTSSGEVYELCTDSTLTDGDYLIVNTNSTGAAYAAEKGSNTLTGSQVSVYNKDGKKHIKLSAEDAKDMTWTVSARTGNTYYLYNKGNFLDNSSNSFAYTLAVNTNHAWTYSSNKLSYSSRYISFSGSSVTLSSSSSSVYLYKRLEGADPSEEPDPEPTAAPTTAPSTEPTTEPTPQPTTEPAPEPSATVTRYELLTGTSGATFEANGDYLIVSANSASSEASPAYAMKKDGTGITKTIVTVNAASSPSNTFYIEDSEALADCVLHGEDQVSGDKPGAQLYSSSTEYLKSDGTDISFTDKSSLTSGYYWNISDNGNGQVNYRPASGTKYYIFYNNGDFMTKSGHDNSDVQVYAYKAKTYGAYTITATASEGGTVTPSGATAVLTGSSKTYTVTPDEGYLLGSFTVNGEDKTSDLVNNQYTVTADKDYEIAVTFVPDVTHTITATAGEGGTISPQGNVVVGDKADRTFTVMPDSGYRVKTVTVDGNSAALDENDQYTFTDVTEDHTIEVAFEKIPEYTITATAGAGGSISPLGANTVFEGEDLAFTVTVDYGYRFKAVTVDGSSAALDENDQYTFTDVTEDHTIEVSFEKIPTYTITATAGAGGSISDEGETTLMEGGSKTYTVTADSGYIVDTVTVDGKQTVLASGSTYTFADVDADHTISVTFVENSAVKYVYALTDTLTAGDEYIIVSTNAAGTGQAVTNSNSAVAATAVTVVSGSPNYIEDSAELAACKWTAFDAPTYAAITEGTSATDGFLLKNSAEFIEEFLDTNSSSKAYIPIITTSQSYGQDGNNTWAFHWDYTGEQLCGYFRSAGSSSTIKDREVALHYDGTKFAATSAKDTQDTIYLYKKVAVSATTYTVLFQNDDGTTLQNVKVAEGETPEYTGETPTKAPDEQYVYTFAGWSPEITAATGNAVYTATYTSEPKDYFEGHSITLGGDIGLNFFVDVTESEAENAVVVLSYTVNGVEHIYTVELKDAQKDSNGYKVICNVSAPEMTDTITASLFINGEKVSEDSYSVRQYADVILTDADWIADYKTKYDNYDELAALVIAMLNYGGCAQIQFADQHPDNTKMANEGMPAPAPLTTDEINAINAPKPDRDAINEALAGTGLSYYGYTMLLHSKTTLRFYFEKEAPDTDISGITLDGNAAQNYNKKYAFVEVEEIPAYELDENYELRYNNVSLGFYSALTYVKDVLTNSPDDEVTVNTVTAFYRYHQAAVAYFSQDQGGD